jgi:hypothetical protein
MKYDFFVCHNGYDRDLLLEKMHIFSGPDNRYRAPIVPEPWVKLEVNSMVAKESHGLAKGADKQNSILNVFRKKLMLILNLTFLERN